MLEADKHTPMNARMILFRMGAVALGVVAAGAAVETAIRACRLYAATRFIAAHPAYGIFNIPNAEGWYIKEDVRQYVTINSRGLHDRDRWSDGGGVLLLGDSFIAAFQVPLETSCQEVSEQLLSEATGRPVEVTAAACNGWGPTNQMAFLCGEGFSYNPAAVVLALFPENDLMDIMGPPPAPVPWPPPPRHGPLLLSPLFARQLVGTAVHGALSSRMPAAAALLTPGAERAERALVRGLYHVWQREPTALQNRMWARLTSLLEAMRDSTHAHGAGFGVLLVPGRLSLYPHEAQRLIQSKPTLRAADLDPPRLRARLAAVLDSLAIPYHDPSPSFRRLASAGVDPLFRREGHWNVEGNRAAAEGVAEFVVERELLHGAPPTAPLAARVIRPPAPTP